MAQKNGDVIGGIVLLVMAVLAYILWKNGTIGKFLSGFKGSTTTTTGNPSSANGISTTSGTSGTSSTTTAKSSGSGSSSSTSSGGTTTVQSGDSLSSIAAQYGVSLTALEQANSQITNPNLIYPGQKINLPSGSQNPGTSGYTGSSGSSTSSSRSGVPGYTAQNAQTDTAKKIYSTTSTGSGQAINGTTHNSSSNSFIYYSNAASASVSALASSHPVSISGLSAAQVGYLKSLAQAGRLAGVTSNGQPIFKSSSSSVATTQTGSGTAINGATHNSYGSTGYGSTNATVAVQSGQSLSSIAAAHGMSLSQIEAMNHQISNFNLIYPGEQVHL